MKRRGQAALEFLTTYGWALLVILVMIGALVYFGLLNPSRILPNKCTATTGFVCEDYQITQNSFDIVLVNKLGDTIKSVDFQAAGVSSEGFITAPTGTDCGPSANVVNADQRFTLQCNTTNLFQGVSDKVSVNVMVTYIQSKQVYNKTLEVTLYAPVS